MKIVFHKGAKNILGPAIRQARLQSRTRMSQEDLAELITSMGLKIHRSKISRMENQEIPIDDIHLLFLAAALNLDIQKLFRLHCRNPFYVPAYEEFRSDSEIELQVAEEPPEASW